MDTTYWGRKFGVVTIKDHLSGHVLWRKFIDRKERIEDYVEGISGPFHDEDGQGVVHRSSGRMGDEVEGLPRRTEHRPGRKVALCPQEAAKRLPQRQTEHAEPVDIRRPLWLGHPQHEQRNRVAVHRSEADTSAPQGPVDVAKETPDFGTFKRAQPL